jgi:hypothetical protein
VRARPGEPGHVLGVGASPTAGGVLFNENRSDRESENAHSFPFLSAIVVSMEADRIELALPAGLVEEIAQRACELTLARLEARELKRAQSPLMTVAETADYLRCKQQRVYELRSSRRLTPLSEHGRALCAREEVEQLIREDVVKRKRRS